MFSQIVSAASVVMWVGRSLRVRRSEIRTSGQAKSKTEKLVSVHNLWPRTGLVGPMSVQSDWVGYHVYLRHVTSVCWHAKPYLESGPVTADLTTTVVQSYKSLINLFRGSIKKIW